MTRGLSARASITAERRASASWEFVVRANSSNRTRVGPETPQAWVNWRISKPKPERPWVSSLAPPFPE